MKDGDKVGWNYVSFRDDNIRVDHKWTDGVARFSRGGVGPSKLGDGKQRYYEVPFAKAVDKIVSNRIKNKKATKAISNDYVFLGETPDVLSKIGFVKLPVVMTQHHVETCYFGPKRGKALGVEGHLHNLNDTIKRVPNAMKTPVMVIASKSPTGAETSIVEVTSVRTPSGDVILPIIINGEPNMDGGRITAHIVASAHGRDNAWEGLVKDALKAEADGDVGVFYMDKAKASKVFNRLAKANPKLASAGLKYAKKLQGDGIAHSITDPDSPVKGQAGLVKDQTASRQFKEWFGKSKVVNRAGQPQVVYHGTPNGKFWTFDKNRVGETWGADEAGFFFTSSKALAEDYTKPYFKESSADPNLFSVYLSIQNPLVIDRAWWQKNFGRSDIHKHDAVEIWDNEQRTILDAMREGGHDGVIIDPNPMAGEPKMYMVPEPNQIKSATDNIGTFDSGNNDVRFQRVRGVDWSDITMDIFKFVPKGSITAMGETEQSAAGLAGAIEKRGALRPWTKADSPAANAKPIAFDAADMVMFWRAVSGSLRNPHVQKGERIKGRPSAIGLNIGGDRIEIVAKLFGVIDESDIKKLHEDCRAEGYFRNENTDWCAANDKGAIEDERLRSQAELDRRTRELYKTRVETGKGGEHYATQVLGHEIGHTLGLLPTGAKLGKVGDATRTLYEAFEAELKTLLYMFYYAYS